MRRLRAVQLGLVATAIGLAAAGIVLLTLAANTSGANCTFDNFSCKSNRLLGDGLRCLFAAVTVALLSMFIHWWRRRQRRSKIPAPHM